MKSVEFGGMKCALWVDEKVQFRGMKRYKSGGMKCAGINDTQSVRGPPYESWAKWTNFLSSWENGDFFWGQNCCTLFHTQNEEKS